MSANKINIKRQVKDTVAKLKQAIAHPSVSSLIFGYLKEKKDLNLGEMTVEQWRKIEKDLVEIILAETFPGEEVVEEQLSFTALANSIAFMSNFIESLNKNLNDSDVKEKAPNVEHQTQSTKKFEL